jgi:cyclohexanone monooxygenase
MSRQVTDTKTRPRVVETVIIGGGFGGIGTGVKLSQAGRRDFVIIDRGEDVGGAWRANTYPGAACDVPSNLYSFSFARNPKWSRSFSQQPEIEAYIKTVAEKHRLRDKLITGTEVLEVRWDAGSTQWRVRTTNGDFEAKYVVSAVGPLTEPALPDIKGIESFGGEIFHSARWNHDSDLTGKRVAVIGTGASAIQIVPQLAKIAGQLDVYQRTAPWILPRLDREYTKAEKTAFKWVPGFQKLSRLGIYATREAMVVGLTMSSVFMKPFEAAARAMLRQQVPDRALRKKVTPNFAIGCKRMLLSNNYYPALSQPNVDVVADGIAEITPAGITAKDGKTREYDAIVVATGFHVTDSPTFGAVFGADGRSAAQQFEEEGQQGYKGTTISNFPNMFFLLGPNSGLGHTSMVYILESQFAYVLDAMRAMDQYGIATFDVRKDVQDRYNQDIQKDLEGTVWSTGGCASWYTDSHGRNTTLWPTFTWEFRRITRKFDLIAYDTVAAADLPSALPTQVIGKPETNGKATTMEAVKVAAAKGDAK